MILSKFEPSACFAMLARARSVAAAALQRGSLRPIETEAELFTAPGSAPFALRVVKSLAHKDAKGASRDVTKSVGDKKEDGAAKKKFNPFLPYDPDMFVADVVPAHVVLLNKFPVVADHVLLVTAAYEPQNALLTATDFSALWQLLSGVGGLAFYNAGRIAGASQHHKHLQLVAGELGPGLQPGQAPFDALLCKHARVPGEIFHVPDFRFVHFAVSMTDCGSGDPEAAASASMARYTDMLQRAIRVAEEFGGQAVEDNSNALPLPYNLLISREWMLLVPRRNECFDEVSVNALGFCGCLLLRNGAQLEVVKEAGPMAVLEHTGFPVGRQETA